MRDREPDLGQAELGTQLTSAAPGASCHFPVTVRITGRLGDDQIDRLAAQVERAVTERISAADRELAAHVRGRAATLAPPAGTVSGAETAVAQARSGQRSGAHHRHPQPARHPRGDAEAKVRGTAAPPGAGTPGPGFGLVELAQLTVAATAGALPLELVGISLTGFSPPAARRGGRPLRTAAPRGPAAGPGAIAKPVPGINKIGFIDNSDGANIRTGPLEAGGAALRAAPLPPATQVFVGGTYPHVPQWWYVTAYLPGAAGGSAGGGQAEIIRGYVQSLRITTDLPEPLAKLHQVKPGDTAERLAREVYHAAIQDGHDLRYYENVLLYVNAQQGRAGVTGTYQDPGLFGGGANNVQLVAGHRIWLVSPAFARTLEGIVPSGSLTGGAVAKARRFARRIEDILDSIAESRNHLDEVAGEYAQAIHDHLTEIIGIIAAFLAAEAASIIFAAVPGGQLVAVLIQLALAAFGAAGAVQAGVEAVKHASEWLTLAWNASGDQEKIVAASKEFLRMLVSIAMAALAYLGVKGNLARAVEIASSLPPGAVPALVSAGGGQRASAAAGSGIRLGLPGPAGPVGTALATTIRGEETGSSEAAPAEPPAAGRQPEAEDLDPSQATRPEVTGGKRPRVGDVRVATRRVRRLDIGDFELRPGETTQLQALARIKRVIFKKISDTPLGRVWEQARREVVGNRSLESATRQEMLGLYDKVRNRFWDLAGKDPGATRFLADAGFEFGSGRAPLLKVNDPAIPIQERRISLDHNLEKALGENYKKAIDADNLTFEFHNPNSNRETVQVKFGLRGTEAGAEE